MFCRSPTAKWMVFPEAKYEGHCTFRGLASYPDGQPFEPKLKQIYGKGQRAGFLPISPTKVYWFVCCNRASLGPKITDGTFFKEATELVKDWPSDLLNIIDNTPGDGFASVEDAHSSYGSSRWLRIFPLTLRANLVGSLLQWEDPVVCFETMSSSPSS